MTTFSWKRKVGDNVLKEVSSKFEAEAKAEVSQDEFLSIRPKRRQKNEENRRLKSEELKAEGVRLAELNRFEEALEEWDRAISLMPDEKTLEMKAQMDLPFRAVQCALRAVHMNPRWWVAYQTLGRAQLAMGDLQMAKRSFSKAIHLNPVEREVWEEDLNWTMELLLREKEKRKKEEEEEALKQPYAI